MSWAIRTIVISVLLLATISFNQAKSEDVAIPNCNSVNPNWELNDLKACGEDGFLKAQLILGARYYWEGVDYSQAYYWNSLAAEAGDSTAQLKLGDMYNNGLGLVEDDTQAALYYKLSADQGNEFAQVELGILYYKGDGVPEDFVLAYMWWNLAASQGGKEAQQNKELVKSSMTKSQIEEAQKLSREWVESRK